MRGAWFIAIHELRSTLRQRETWLWTFVMPIVFFYFFGAIQGDRQRGVTKDALVLQAPPDAGFLADAIERRLGERDYAVERIAAAPEQPADRRVEVPSDFTARVLRGEQSVVHFASDASGSAGDFDEFRIGRAVYSVLADIVALQASEKPVTPQTLDELARMPRSLSLEVKPAGVRKEVPSGREHSIPGTLVMFTMIVLLTSGSIGVVIDRRQGLLRRLASTPMARGEIVLGRWLGILALGLVQIAFGVLVATLLFHVDWGPDPALIGVVLFGWAAFSTSLAMLLASLVSTEGQVIGAGVLASNVLAALGGCWWPIEITPGWMQRLASWLPTGWVMNALHELMFFGSGLSGALRGIALLTGGALVLGVIAARRFKFL
jgi:ABC-type Na+ efflux pump permease subunit